MSDRIDQLYSDLQRIGYNHVAYCTFAYYGDKKWMSSPIPLVNANQHNITIPRNVKNTTAENETEIAAAYFKAQTFHDCFCVVTENENIAGYIFKTTKPGIVWEITYNVYKL